MCIGKDPWRWSGISKPQIGTMSHSTGNISCHQDLTCHICHQDLTVVVRPNKCSDFRPFFYSCAIISANSRAAIGIVLCQIKVASGFNTYLWGIWHWYHQPYIALRTKKMWVTFHWSGQLAGGCCRLQDNNWQFVVWRLNWTQPAGYGSLWVPKSKQTLLWWRSGRHFGPSKTRPPSTEDSCPAGRQSIGNQVVWD